MNVRRRPDIGISSKGNVKDHVGTTAAGAGDELRRAGEITVVIPAAGRVPEGLLGLSNIACPAMIPVAGRPVIHWTLRYLRSLGLRRFVIAVARRGMFIEDFVECAFGQDCDVSFVVPPPDGGVGRTVLELLERVTTPRALVVLGDTHFQFADPSVLDGASPFVLTGPVDDSGRWCIAETTPVGVVERLRDKEQGLAGPLAALVGVYGFPDVDAARTAARETVAEAQAAGRRAELKGVLDRVRADAPLRALPAGLWLDCGNADRQAASHQALLQARAFNELAIDPVMGTITKRSRNVDKFLDEIDYLRLLPAELAVFFPRVLAARAEHADPSLTLEYYGYPTLSEVFVFENVDAGVWERVFEHLAAIQARFLAHQRPLAPGAVSQMLLGKTRERADELARAGQGPPELHAMLGGSGSITVNGTPRRALGALWPELEREVARLEGSATGAVIHGDLGFSNILYDLRSRICKLVDPRGSFGVRGVHGDPRYDVAKLYHSVHGLYDFLVADLFRVDARGGAVTVDVRARPHHVAIRERFEQVYFERGGWDRRDILLITGLLFASMPALHYDRPDRQLAMAARALELIGDALDGVRRPVSLPARAVAVP